MNISELMKRKVAGVPVLYLAAAFVVILAVVAWRMKPSEAAPDPDDMPVEEQPEGLDGSADYSSLATKGTVTVVQENPVTKPEAEVPTNDTWLRKAVAFLISDKAGNAQTTPGIAQTAMSKYLDGQDLSYDEGRFRDAAVRELGLPPDGSSRPTVTGQKPGQRQFMSFPGSHKVIGGGDDTAGRLAALYYGGPAANSWEHVSQIIAANPSTLVAPQTLINPGTVVKIPAYRAPVMFKVTKDTLSKAKIAAKNGISVAQLDILNPKLKVQEIVVGKLVRVV